MDRREENKKSGKHKKSKHQDNNMRSKWSMMLEPISPAACGQRNCHLESVRGT